MANKFEELENIKKLKDNGTITEQEYEIEKIKILNRGSNSTEGIYIASLVLGIASFLFGAIPFIGFIISLVALIINIISRKKLKANNETNSLVTVGLVLSILGLLAAIFMTILPLIMVILNSSRAINGI